MTRQEQAKELVHKAYLSCGLHTKSVNVALFCIGEKIKELGLINKQDLATSVGTNIYLIARLLELREVKQEINKL